MSNYKNGDLVQVFDGSYSLTVEANQFRHACGTELTNREFEVMYTDLKLPSSDKGKFNTIIIKAKDNNQIVYIQERMIKPSPKKVENITYNIILIIEEGMDIDAFTKELDRKIKLASIKM